MALPGCHRRKWRTGEAHCQMISSPSARTVLSGRSATLEGLIGQEHLATALNDLVEISIAYQALEARQC